ncbi:Retrovirus-related Pol polyprotein from transposon TNT 1-94 [Cardamine amara subsp. amara]|uniref:Retrovirus-related Pol polyprotein from transposon TNT 1-94 n=1 Tax=Cardamine amara subsp. amara TaxID=228776 RepID=A0ABD1AQ20_CARAN
MPNVVFDNSKCEYCILGKHCRSVFQNSISIYENCFDLVHSDVWTSPCLSRDNLKYFVTFIDEKSKYTWVTLLPSKDKVFEAFVNFQTYVTNHFNANIKVLRSDNGGEYTSNTFKAHLANHGILHQTSCPYTPQQNGVAERKNRHLMEVARSMMFHKNMPRRFWGDAVMTACYLINRTPTKVLNDISPYEVLNKTKPHIDHLRVFGCVCFVLVPGDQRNKLDAKSTRSVFIGYSTTQKGYRCYDPSTKRIMTSRDVKFLEDQSYFEKSGWESVKDLADSTADRAASLQHLLTQLGLPPMNQDQSAPANNQENLGALHRQDDQIQDNLGALHRQDDQIQEEGVNVQNERENDEEINEQGGVNQETPPEANVHENEVHEEEAAPAPTLRRSTRQRFGPEHWKQTKVYYNNQAVAHPIQAECSLALLPSDHQAFLGKIEQHYIPKTYEEAKGIKVWMDAVNAEKEAMDKNHTWDVRDLPPGKRAVTSRWIFTIKYHSNGEIERYKARLVARGFTQTYGEDYTDTFAPVAKLHTVRVILSLATNLSWELWQMDVKNAFLQGELEEEVYMKPPPGLESSIPQGKVFKLRKAIYGLKQSPRAWYHKLSFTLTAKGFRRSEADHTLFTSQSAQGIIVVLVYVDDLIISGNDQAGIQETKLFLKSAFDIKDLGELKYFLGIEICRSPEGLFLSQRKYSLDLLTETGKLGSKPAKTPLEDGYKVRRKGEKGQEDPLDRPFEDPAQYRRLVGKLIYLTITRPDLCFAVNQVSQHMKEPSVHHWNMVERILRYIKGSPGQGVWMGKNDSTEIVGYCDADYAGDTMDRRSTTGYCTFIGGNLVTWKSKKQKVVSCSSAESEYRAMKKLTNELVWLKALLKDLGIESTSPITMHCDNQAAIHIATNSVFHERTKHIEVDCHKVREKIIEGVILPCYTRSEDQLADIFTKATSLKICNHIYNKLGLVDLTHP